MDESEPLVCIRPGKPYLSSQEQVGLMLSPAKHSFVFRHGIRTPFSG